MDIHALICYGFSIQDGLFLWCRRLSESNVGYYFEKDNLVAQILFGI